MPAPPPESEPAMARTRGGGTGMSPNLEHLDGPGSGQRLVVPHCLHAELGPAAALEAANDSGALAIDDPPTIAMLLFGALTRAGLLIASSPEPAATRDAVAAALHAMITGFAPRPGVDPSAG
jgi:hypothetical protein